MDLPTVVASLHPGIPHPFVLVRQHLHRVGLELVGVLEDFLYPESVSRFWWP